MSSIVKSGRLAVPAVLLVVGLGFVSVGWGLHRIGYRLNLSASHPIGIYRIVDREPAIGLYALFCVPTPIYDLPPLDRRVPPCTKDTPGYPVLKRIVRIDVERGEYHVQGDHPRSLDSRVFGPLRHTDITSVAVAVWAF